MPTKHTLFRPTAWETKAAGIDAAAKLIVETETAARNAKTKRLRAARMELPPPEPALRPSRTRPRSSTPGGLRH